MKKNILLPTDFSDNAWSAAVYALKLFVNEDCTFYFLHSAKIKASTMSNMTNKLLKVMLDNAKRDLLDLKDIAEAIGNKKHTFEIILSSKDIEDTIKASIEGYSIDYIVMGTKGASGVKELFFGSNTVKILKKINNCPVVIVPDEYDYIPVKQIAFPTDFNHFYDTELEPVKSLAEAQGSKIRIVHINKEKDLTDQQNYNLAMLKAYLEEHPHSFHWMPNYAKKREEINDFIEELDINLLAMIKYKHSVFENIFNEPVIKKISFNPIIPFMVIPSSV